MICRSESRSASGRVRAITTSALSAAGAIDGGAPWMAAARMSGASQHHRFVGPIENSMRSDATHWFQPVCASTFQK